MLCPYCHSGDSKIIDTRKYDTCDLRVHRCCECNKAWDTEELVRTIKVSKPVKTYDKTKSLYRAI